MGMVVVAIVGVLSAVALPELTKAQNKAKSSAALTTAINAGKSCAVAIVVEDLASGNLEASTGTSFTNSAISCATDAAFVVERGRCYRQRSIHSHDGRRHPWRPSKGY